MRIYKSRQQWNLDSLTAVILFFQSFYFIFIIILILKIRFLDYKVDIIADNIALIDRAE